MLTSGFVWCTDTSYAYLKGNERKKPLAIKVGGEKGTLRSQIWRVDLVGAWCTGMKGLSLCAGDPQVPTGI